MSTFICVGTHNFNLADVNHPDCTVDVKEKFARKLRRTLNKKTTGYSRCSICGTKKIGKDFCIMCRYKPWAIKTKSIIRYNLSDVQKSKCCYCGEFVPFDDQTLEHIQPKSMGGKNIFANFAMACRPCNNRRGNDDINLVLNHPVAYSIKSPKNGVTPKVRKGKG